MIAVVTIVLLLYIGLLVLFAALAARKQSWKVTLMRTVSIILSAVIAAPLSKAISFVISNAFSGALGDVVGETLTDLTDAIPLVGESMVAIVALLIAPILFLMIFSVIRLVLGIVVRILAKLIIFLKSKPSYNMFISLPVGIFNGILVGVITLIPLCGFIMLGAHTVDAFNESEAVRTELMEENDDVAEAMDIIQEATYDLSKSPVIGTVYFVGSPMFNRLTSTTLDGGNIDFALETEICHLTRTLGDGVVAMDGIDNANYTKRDKQNLMTFADTVFESQWLTRIMADIISELSSSWKEDHDFMGIEPLETDPMLQPTVDSIVNVLSGEDHENISEDLHTILDILGDMMMNGLLDVNIDVEDLMAKLGEDGLLSEMLGKLESNEHLSPLVAEFENLSVRVVASVLGSELLESGEHDEMLTNVAGTLTDALSMPRAEREQMVREGVREAFVEYGYEVPEDVAIQLSEKAIADLGTDGEVTLDELKTYFSESLVEEPDLVGDIVDDNLLPEDVTGSAETLPVDLPDLFG